MRRKNLIILFIIVLVCLGGVLFVLKNGGIAGLLFSEKSKDNSHKQMHFSSAIEIPMNFSPFGNRPIMNVRIGGRKCFLVIDLGSSHPIDLHPQTMKKIQNKEFLGTTKYIGIRKKAYETRAFRLPQVKLSTVLIDGLVGFEENLDFIQDAKIKKSKGCLSWSKNLLEQWLIDGRVGWTFFQNQVVFLDFPRFILTIAKDMDSLIGKIDTSLSNFLKVPFDQKEWGMIVLFKTDLGVQRFLLDTGASCSVLQESLVSHSKQSSVYTSNIMEIASHDLGPWKFHLLEYIDSNHYDGILGVDFFKNRQICIDFDKKVLYVQPI